MKTTRDFFSKVVHGEATRDQAKDTGMAAVLILLLLALSRQRSGYLLAAVVLHVVTMTAPAVYRPIAVVWLGFAEVLGTVVSKVLLSIVFFLVVTPIGLWRRLLGSDSLRLKAFKNDRRSVMEVRNHTFVSYDIERPY